MTVPRDRGVLAGLAVAVASGLAALAVLLDVRAGGLLAGLDGPLLAAAVEARTPHLTPWVVAVTDAGGGVGRTVLVLLVGLPLAVREHSRRPVVLLAAAGLAGWLLSDGLKLLVGRPRPPVALAVPPHPTTLAWPSGHALGSAAVVPLVAALLWPLLRRAWQRALLAAAAAAFVLAVGASRVYLGVHWGTDVLGGWALGLALAALVVAVDRWRSPQATRGEPRGAGGEVGDAGVVGAEER